MANQTNTTDALLTEYLSAVDNTDDSIDGAAKITYAKVNQSWQTDSGEELDSDPDEYHVECEECGGTFSSWQKATKHAETDH